MNHYLEKVIDQSRVIIPESVSIWRVTTPESPFEDGESAHSIETSPSAANMLSLNHDSASLFL